MLKKFVPNSSQKNLIDNQIQHCLNASQEMLDHLLSEFASPGRMVCVIKHKCLSTTQEQREKLPSGTQNHRHAPKKERMKKLKVDAMLISVCVCVCVSMFGGAYSDARMPN